MSVAYSWTGTVADSVSTPNPAYPASGIASGDQVLLTVVNKPETAMPTTPTGFSLLATGTGGSGTAGSDTGPVRITVFNKVAAGTEASTTVPVNVTSATGTSAVLTGFTKTAANWVVVNAGIASDTVANTTLTATAPNNITIASGDHLVGIAALATDSVNISASSTTVPSTTIGAWTERVDTGGTTGDDRRLALYDADVTAGTSTGAATITFTLGASAPGAVGLIRLKDTDSSPPVANAGVDQTVFTNDVVTLNGSGSSDSDGTITSYAWAQTSGTTVTLSSTSAVSPTFTPTVVGTYVFGLIVTDNDANTSPQDSVTINVTLPAGKYAAIGGSWTYKRTYRAGAGSWQT